MLLRDLKELGLDTKLCCVKEPEHSLRVVRELEQKYGMTYEEAKESGRVPWRDLALWEHSLAMIGLASGQEDSIGDAHEPQCRSSYPTRGRI